MTLDELETIIASRAAASADDSWTARLLAKGPEKVAEKFGEEAIEALIEAVKGDSAALTSEAADVLFHLLVMLHSRGASTKKCSNGWEPIGLFSHPACRENASGLSWCGPT